MTTPTPMPLRSDNATASGRPAFVADGTESHLWLSDREIGADETRSHPMFTASDYRGELERVERKRFKVAVAVIATFAVVVAIVAFFLIGILSRAGVL